MFSDWSCWGRDAGLRGGLPGRALVESAGGEAGAHPGRHAADPRLQLHPRLLIHQPRPRQHDRRRFLFIIIQLVLINIKLKVNG